MRHWFQRLGRLGKRKADGSRVVLALEDGRLSWLQATRGADGTLAVQRAGVIDGRGEPGDTAALTHRLRELRLSGSEVIAVLPPAHYQLLQIEAPSVPRDELRAAARWRIKDLVDAHIDDLTLDVLRVGDDRQRAPSQLYVVAALTQRIGEIGACCEAAGLALGIVDVAETAQRNLQSTLADAAGVQDEASAALVLHGGQCLFTVSAGGELFYSRRLPWDERGLHGEVPVSGPGLDFELPQEEGGLIHYEDPQPHDDAPALVIEVQRSLDVWERTWPGLPVALLYVQAGEHTAALIEALIATLPIPVRPLEPQAAFSALPTLDAATRTAVLPLLGAALRDDARAL